MLRSTKSGRTILPRAAKWWLCHKLFTFESPYRRKIRRFKTVLVVYLVQWNYARDPMAEAPRGLFHTLLLTICKRPEEKPLDRRRY